MSEGNKNKHIKDSDIHKNHRERMRKRYIEEGGFSSFEDHQVLEFLLFYCVPRMDTNGLAHRLINEYGGFGNLMDADPIDIMNRCGVGENTAILINMIPQLARLYFKLHIDIKEALDTSRKIGEYARSLLAGRRNECFFCICLDVKRRVIGTALIAEGSVSHAEVYPRNIAECAMKFNASGLVLAHNHPSGDILPSESDINTTRVIKKALDFLDVEVVDHIIIGADRYFSFIEHKVRI